MSPLRATCPSSRLQRSVLFTAGIVLGLATGALPLSAQQTGTLAGRIVDAATGDAVAGADVVLKTVGSHMTTGADGGFRFERLRDGTYTLEVSALGYTTLELPVELSPAQPELPSLLITLEPDPVVLEDVAAGTQARAVDPRLVGFWHRKGRENGYFFTREDIERRASHRLLDIFRGIPGARVVPTDDGHTGWYVTFGRMAHRGVCPPLVFLDGTPFSLADTGFDVIRSDEIEAVETYVSMASIPVEFRRLSDRTPPPRNGQTFAIRGSTACGVIVLWSRSGGRSD